MKILSFFVCFLSFNDKFIGCYSYFTPLGCYKDDSDYPDLSKESEKQIDSGDPEDCAELCSYNGFPYAGMKNGTLCRCGQEYGRSSYSFECDRSCENNNTDGITYAQCGGTESLSIFYAVDTDPVIRMKREEEYHADLRNFTTAREICVKAKGDLVVLPRSDFVQFFSAIKKKENILEETEEIWIGLSQHWYNKEYTWTSPAERSADQSVSSRVWTSEEKFKNKCVAYNFKETKIITKVCTEAKPFICTQIPSDVGNEKTTAMPKEDDAPTNALAEGVLFYVMIALFGTAYGGSCVFYVVGKSIRLLKKQQKKAKLARMERERRRQLYLDAQAAKYYPGKIPPPYYRATVRPLKKKPEEKNLRAKTYAYEVEAQSVEATAIDYSKLSINDIMYIKALSGEKHARPSSRKKILTS